MSMGGRAHPRVDLDKPRGQVVSADEQADQRAEVPAPDRVAAGQPLERGASVVSGREAPSKLSSE